MTMKPGDVEDSCKNCCALRTEIYNKAFQAEQNNAQQLAGFLTLKQKIVATDKLIREYQSSKVECDILTRKNEEFARLIDQLHRDLSTRTQDFTQLYSEIEPVKKVNAEYEVKVKELQDEAQKWKFETEAGKNFTAQLVEKVKVLEKYEEEVKGFSTMSKDYEKMESKMELLKEQLKDAKEAAGKFRKDLNKIQKSNKQLTKYAKLWGKVAETHGKFNVLQKRFYTKLCNDDGKNNSEDDDADMDDIEEGETDEQSKLLEQLLSDGDGADGEMAPPDILSSDTEMSKGNVKSSVKAKGKSPIKTTPSPKVGQISPRMRKRSGQDNVTPSKTKSPDKTPTRTPITRRRSRTASTVSENNSDTDVTAESEKEIDKRVGPRTRSRSIRASVTDLKGPEPVHTPKRAETKTVLPDLAGDNAPKISMHSLLETGPVIGISLSSSESDTEMEAPKKLPPAKAAVTAKPTTSSCPQSSKSIAGIKPLMNLFEPDVLDDIPRHEEKAATTEQKTSEQLKPASSANSSSLFGFGFGSSDSESDEEIRTSSQNLLTNEPSNQAILTETSASVTTFAGIFEKTNSISQENPVSEIVPSAENSPKRPVSGTEDPTIDQKSTGIFNLEEDLEISSSELTSDASVTNSNQETVLRSDTGNDEETPIQSEINQAESIEEPVNNPDVNAQLHIVPDEDKPRENEEEAAKDAQEKNISDTVMVDDKIHETTEITSVNQEETQPVACIKSPVESKTSVDETRESETMTVEEEKLKENQATDLPVPSKEIENEVPQNHVDVCSPKQQEIQCDQIEPCVPELPSKTNELLESAKDDEEGQIVGGESPNDATAIPSEKGDSSDDEIKEKSPLEVETSKSVKENLDSQPTDISEVSDKTVCAISSNVAAEEDKRDLISEPESIEENKETAPMACEHKSPAKTEVEHQAVPVSTNDPDLDLAPKKKLAAAPSPDVDKQLVLPESSMVIQPTLFEEKQEIQNSLQPIAPIVEPVAVKTQVKPSSCRFAAEISDAHPVSKESNIPNDITSMASPFPIIPEPMPVQHNFHSGVPSLPGGSQPSAFKVPRVPDPIREPLPPNMHPNFPWSKGVTHGVKRSAADDEVTLILKQIRTSIIPMPATISPLPKSPPPKPLIQVKEEPKCRFPILPRCAFNWAAKKLPISDRLTEQFGAYLHPGVQVRVRFRRVGKRRLRDLRSADILSHSSQGVANFAEAERRPKPFVNLVPPAQDACESETKLPAPKPCVPVQESSNLPEKKPSLAVPPCPSSAPETIDLSPVKAKVSKPIAKAVPVREKAQLNRSKVDGLFGSDSSESEPENEAEVCLPPIQERPKRPSTLKSLKEGQQLEATNDCRPTTTPLASTPRAKLLAQALPILPLGKANRPDSLPIKPAELRREPESPSLTRLGLGRVPKPSGHAIAPCSEALLSAVGKPKTITRVVAPLRRPLKEPEVPTPAAPTPAATTPILSDSSLDESPFRKRVSHALKRGLDPDAAAISNLASPSKRGKSFQDTLASPSPLTPQSPVPTKLHTEGISARKNENVLPVKPQEFAKLGRKVTSPSVEAKSGQPIELSRTSHEVAEQTGETVVEDVDANEIEPEVPMEQTETDGTSSSEEGRSSTSHENPSQLPNNPQSPAVEESPQSPDIEESPQSPDMEESPQSPDDQFMHLSANETVKIVPTSPEKNKQEQPSSAFELVSKQLLQKSPPIVTGSKKLRKDVHSFINRIFKAPELTDDLFSTGLERMIRPDSRKAPSILIRQLVAGVINCWEAPMDLSMTPPAPPMTVVHQRCVLLLKHLDEENEKLELEPDANKHKYSDFFLSEVSAIMFQQNSQLKLEEMCSLARAYTAVCRSRGSLSRARTFLFDCLYSLPPRSYALTFTIISVWVETLRQPTFPLGLSCIDQTIAYLLLHCCKVRAVPGPAGKVLQVRSFLQNTYGYKNATTSTIDDLLNYLMTRFKETNSVDEASSLSWSLALLARWEGIDFAINVIEKHLWPFLQRWSSGEGTNAGAAGVIVAIGMLGKTVPPNKRAGVKSVLGAMKVLCQSDEIMPSIQEAAVEAVILLGESDDPNSVIEFLKSWKLVNSNLSPHLQQVLRAFLKRHPDLVV